MASLKDLIKSGIKEIFGIDIHTRVVMPLEGVVSIDLSSTDYTHPSGKPLRAIFCDGTAGDVKVQFADESDDTHPVLADDWVYPYPVMIRTVYKTGTTATTLKGYV